MRSIIALVLLMNAFNLNAQSYLPVGIGTYAQRPMLADQSFLNDSTPGKKWFVSRYTGISTSFIFSKFGNATVVSVPLGVQLNRKLTNNLYAFGALSLAPSYVNYNGSFMAPAPNNFRQQPGFMKSSQLNLASRAEMGLMYVNDAKTFSISGSIGIETNTYPSQLYPAQRNAAPAVPVNTPPKF